MGRRVVPPCQCTQCLVSLVTCPLPPSRILHARLPSLSIPLHVERDGTLCGWFAPAAQAMGHISTLAHPSATSRPCGAARSRGLSCGARLRPQVRPTSWVDARARESSRLESCRRITNPFSCAILTGQSRLQAPTMFTFVAVADSQEVAIPEGQSPPTPGPLSPLSLHTQKEGESVGLPGSSHLLGRREAGPFSTQPPPSLLNVHIAFLSLFRLLGPDPVVARCGFRFRCAGIGLSAECTAVQRPDVDLSAVSTSPPSIPTFPLSLLPFTCPKHPPSRPRDGLKQPQLAVSPEGWPEEALWPPSNPSLPRCPGR